MYPATSVPYYMSYPPAGPLIPPHVNPYNNGNLPHQQHSQSLQNVSPAIIETVHLYVPNTVIGAIIGTKGLFIKSIIKNSNASVKVRTY
jgi:hypothetical protein